MMLPDQHAQNVFLHLIMASQARNVTTMLRNIRLALDHGIIALKEHGEKKHLEKAKELLEKLRIIMSLNWDIYDMAYWSYNMGIASKKWLKKRAIALNEAWNVVDELMMLMADAGLTIDLADVLGEETAEMLISSYLEFSNLKSKNSRNESRMKGAAPKKGRRAQT